MRYPVVSESSKDISFITVIKKSAVHKDEIKLNFKITSILYTHVFMLLQETDTDANAS